MLPRRALVLLALAWAVATLAACATDDPQTPRAGGGARTTPAQIANGPVAADGLGESLQRSVKLHHGDDPVPVLMYHVIAAAPGAKYRGLWVPPAELKAQVAALARAGYHAITLADALDGWAGKDTLPPKPVVLTFDDGYLSQGREAGAILAEHGWPGVLNLAWHNLGTPGGVTKTRVRRLIADGWELGAHSLTHPDLTTLDAAALEREVAGSRAAIRKAFGVDVATFCYPAGRLNPTVAAAVRAAGYRAATSELPGAATPTQDRYALSRIRVDAGDSASAVLARVRAAAPHQPAR